MTDVHTNLFRMYIDHFDHFVSAHVRERYRILKYFSKSIKFKYATAEIDNKIDHKLATLYILKRYRHMES